MPSRAYVEALLEGVPLPATRDVLIKYAEHERDEQARQALETLPDRMFSTLDEVGEALAPVQPQWPRQRRVPKPESDLPPGGPAYGIMPT